MQVAGHCLQQATPQPVLAADAPLPMLHAWSVSLTRTRGMCFLSSGQAVLDGSLHTLHQVCRPVSTKKCCCLVFLQTACAGGAAQPRQPAGICRRAGTTHESGAAAVCRHGLSRVLSCVVLWGAVGGAAWVTAFDPAVHTTHRAAMFTAPLPERVQPRRQQTQPTQQCRNHHTTCGSSDQHNPFTPVTHDAPVVTSTGHHVGCMLPTAEPASKNCRSCHTLTVASSGPHMHHPGSHMMLTPSPFQSAPTVPAQHKH